MKMLVRLSDTKEVVTLSSVKGGWSTIFFNDGKMKKIRNSNIEYFSSEKNKMQDSSSASSVGAYIVKDKFGEKYVKVGNSRSLISNYYVSDTRTSSGRRTIDCNDKIAELLRGKSIDEVYQIVSNTLNITVNELMSRYSKLNVGMQRMALGNCLRGHYNKQAKKEAKQQKELEIV